MQIRDPGWKKCGSGIRNKHPGSATLLETIKSKGINVCSPQGLQDIKELHWHARIPGLVVATSHTGFDVFKTISV
jgi:hypothetical protein